MFYVRDHLELATNLLPALRKYGKDEDALFHVYAKTPVIASQIDPEEFESGPFI